MYYLRVIPSILGTGNHTLTMRKLDDDSFHISVVPVTKKLLGLYGVGFLSYSLAYNFLFRCPLPCVIRETSSVLPFIFERDFYSQPDIPEG